MTTHWTTTVYALIQDIKYKYSCIYIYTTSLSLIFLKQKNMASVNKYMYFCRFLVKTYQVVSKLNIFGHTIYRLCWLEFQDIVVLMLLYRF